MGKQINIKATLSENVNKVFRVKTKFYHIIHKHHEVKRYPIIINNFNRLEYLQQQIEWLLKAGQTNLHIVDNGSTYEPLLRYYKTVPATVYKLDRNVGHESFWRTHLHQRFGRYYHVYTDPDVLPDENTPTDFMYYFKSLLDKYPTIKKVGFGLITNDLPDHYSKKEEVITWEKQFTADEIEPGVYRSKIDTTFAMYRPGAFMQCWENTLRTGNPYLLHHKPWYEDPAKADEETRYYMEQATAASSWYNSLKKSSSPYEG
ncbi:MAG: glycosyltransferase family 2 protein [Opitutaceae bacterium]|nr:glycosyltransferase family 2 protein [Cytophagales bacterium]